LTAERPGCCHRVVGSGGIDRKLPKPPECRRIL